MHYEINERNLFYNKFSAAKTDFKIDNNFSIAVPDDTKQLFVIGKFNIDKIKRD